MDYIDLRSDTVTWPTEAMREAMAKAVVGDDVYGEDPTVNALEALAAEKLGKEAGLFVASGTMGNVAALLAHCQRGDEMIIGATAHTFMNEGGAASAFGGISPRTLPVQPDGTLKLEDIRVAIRADDEHYPVTRLVSIENTQNAAGGVPLTPEYTAEVGALAKEHGLKFHVDGARIFNAAVALGCDARDLCAPADSLTFCLSKGLSAPVGSVLVGDAAFIRQARRARKALGGGMRQAGIVAAAGIVALNAMVDRLADDHANARRLAEGLAAIEGVQVEVERVKTNMVYFDLAEEVLLNVPEFTTKLRERRILLAPRYDRHFRAVTHYWITPAHIEQVIDAFKDILA